MNNDEKIIFPKDFVEEAQRLLPENIDLQNAIENGDGKEVIEILHQKIEQGDNLTPQRVIDLINEGQSQTLADDAQNYLDLIEFYSKACRTYEKSCAK